jgi:putative ABC transport system permease protein
MSTFLQDLRFALRLIARTPGFTAIAVLTLALGIGANTAVFSVVNAAMIRPLPFPNASRLVDVYHAYTKLNMNYVTVSPGSYVYIRDHSRALEDLAAYTFFRAPQNLTGSGDPLRVRSISATWNLFDVLGSKPALGRTFQKQDDVKDVRVTVLSDVLWRDRFGADPAIVGHDITLEGANYTVIGVMPKGFEFPARAQLWVPFHAEATDLGSEYINTVGILKPGVTRAQLDEDMRAMTAEQLRRDNDTVNRAGWYVAGAPLRDVAVADMKTALWVLLAAVGCVLLIACANVANLLLARATARQKEIAIRVALGASRGRLLRQLLTEGTLLGVMGGVLGLAVAYASLGTLVGLVPIRIPSYIHIAIDPTVMLFTLVLGILTGMFFSLVPALQILRHQHSAEELKQGGRTAAGVGNPKMRNAIVALQLAFAVVLLVSAGLLIKTFIRLQQANFGFDQQNVLTAHLGLPKAKYAHPEQRIAFYSQLIERLKTTPGVSAVGLNVSLPLSGGWSQTFGVEGKTFDVRPHGYVGLINGDYFKTMGIPLLSGRTFSEGDNKTAMPVVIVDTNIVRAYFGSEDPIGKRLAINMRDDYPENTMFTIVGVVGAVRHTNPLEKDTKGQYYLPYTQISIPETALMLKTVVEPMLMANTLRQQVLAIDPTLPLEEVRSMEDLVDEYVAQPRFNMLLIAVFGGLALTLSAIGVYGVMAYSVTQRTHEIGVRMALGAMRQDVMRLILSQALQLAVIGLGIGLIGAFAATRMLASLLYRVRPADPMTFIGITTLLAAITILAGLVPAIRATRIDPLVALRYE